MSGALPDNPYRWDGVVPARFVGRTEQLDDLVTTGPTGTNVMDVALVMVGAGVCAAAEQVCGAERRSEAGGYGS